jgi:hypothetical protein
MYTNFVRPVQVTAVSNEAALPSADNIHELFDSQKTPVAPVSAVPPTQVYFIMLTPLH